jgi:outer membrane protein OmpA-like peptidoglycan-associated protein
MKGKKFALFIILSLFSAYVFAGDAAPVAQALGTTTTAQGAVAGSGLTIYGLTFAKNSAEIPEEAYSKLDGVTDIIGDFLDKKEKPVIQIDGYTDDRGRKEYNIKLSEKRAGSVMAYILDKLRDRGLAEKDFVIKGLGPVNFLADNSTEEGRSANRRIEVKITGRTMEKKVIIAETQKKKPAIAAPAIAAPEKKESGICWGCIGLDALDVALVAYAVYAVNDQWTAANNYNNNYNTLNNAEGTNYNQLLSEKKTVDDKKTPLVIGTCLAGAALVYTAADYFGMHWVYPADIKVGLNSSVNGVMIFAKEEF